MSPRYIPEICSVIALFHTDISKLLLHVYLARGVVEFNAGAWNRVDIYIKLNTIGVHDGILNVWINGTQKVNYTNLVFRNKRSGRYRFSDVVNLFRRQHITVRNTFNDIHVL